MKSNKLCSHLRWIIYIIEIAMVYIIQQNFILIPEIFGGRPLVLLPLLVSIAVFEHEYTSMALGIITGMFLDIGFFGFVGMHTVYMCILGYLTAISTSKFIKANIAVYMCICCISTVIISLLRFLSCYTFGAGIEMNAFFYCYLPGIIYTLIISPIMYFFNRVIAFYIGGKQDV